MKHIISRLTTFFLVVILLLTITPLTQAAIPSQPKLIVLIVVDQLRADYLTRFADLFEKDGFRRFWNEGAVFTNAHFPYVPTYTGPGHAAIGSGTTPSVNGIVGNEWYNRSTGKEIYCVYDSIVNPLGATTDAGRMSPRNFIGSTFGDQLRLATNFRAKVIGIAMKDRAAILPAGRTATAAYWFDAAAGTIISSNYYMEKLPEYIVEFNKRHLPDSYIGKEWRKLLPESAYERTAPDSGLGEGLFPGGNRSTFPHLITKLAGNKAYNAFLTSPFANEFTIELAKEVIEKEKLGMRGVTDLLTVSFSSNDYVGHTFGPYSQEVEDITLRLDRQLAGFFQYLDKKFGKGEVLLVLTADHGVAPNPEYASSHGLDAERLARKSFEENVVARVKEILDIGENVIQVFSNESVYLNYDLIHKLHLKEEAVENAVARAAMEQPGIHAAYTRTQLLRGEVAGDIGKHVLAGFHPRRSGDVIIVTEPFTFFSYGATGTTHGAPYSYDTHVPLLFFGKGIKHGIFTTPSSPTDIAPTLCEILQIEFPAGSSGRVLTEILPR
ncbi:MAG: alkaline phosphatase family protein [Bacteroidota bacterium]